MLLPDNNSYGLYSCSSFLLKCATLVISSPLAEILNFPIQLGKLKFAKVPVFKEGDDTHQNNYTPISLLFHFNRIFEKLMYKRLQSCFRKFDILNPECRSRRYYNATLDIISSIQNNIIMDNKLFSCGIFIDLKKSF